MDGCPYDAEQVDRCKGCPGDCWDEVTLRTEQVLHAPLPGMWEPADLIGGETDQEPQDVLGR